MTNHRAVCLALGVFSFSSTIAKADQLNLMGTANSFAVLGASTVTNTGSSVLNGSLGLYSGTSVTGFPPGTVNGGSIYTNDGTAQQGQADALSGFNALALLSTSTNLTGTDLGGLTLTPGIYTFNSSAQLTGDLTLDFGGLSGQSFVFQTGSTLTTASASNVNLINEGTDDSIYWVVGSSATLGTTTAFEGELIAAQSITLNTGATIGCGNAIALNGAVTLDSNVLGGGCAAGNELTVSSFGGPSPTPEPGTLGMVAMGLVGALGAVRRRLSL
jgi:hypothetical protein